jgi:hypothetical protein
MARPHTENGLLEDGKNTKGEPTDRKIKNKMAGLYVSRYEVMNVKNWKELAVNRKVWNDLVEKSKPTKGCKADGRRGRYIYMCV